MPSTTAKQARFMAAVAHGWQPSGRHVNPKVAREFHAADKRVGKFEHPQHAEHARRLAHALRS